jgi:hypothetical protein
MTTTPDAPTGSAAFALRAGSLERPMRHDQQRHPMSSGRHFVRY